MAAPDRINAFAPLPWETTYFSLETLYNCLFPKDKRMATIDSFGFRETWHEY